jgi:hypothetical protein
MINLSAYFHMTPHKERFCEYEKYNGCDVFLGYDSITRIIERRKVKLFLKDGRIRTLSRIFHIS